MIREDARALCTGFGSLRVRAADGTETRGLLDDDESVVGAGEGWDAIRRQRILRVVDGDLPGLAREDVVEIGALEDDLVLTTFRVLDLRRSGDGVVLEVVVSP